MRAVQILVAIVLSLVMLYVARNNSEGRPEQYVYAENGYAFDFMTVPKEMEHSTATIDIRIDGVDERRSIVLFRYLPGSVASDINNLDAYQTKIMLPSDSASNIFTTTFGTNEKLSKTYFYFEVQSESGAVEARFTKEEETPFRLRAIGHVPAWVLIPHVALMFITVFTVVLAAINGAQLIAGGDTLRGMATWLLWATILMFVGGYPFGFAMNYYAFGVMWEGIPFGTDATDNKTQLLLVYFLIATVSVYGSLIGQPRKNLFGRKTLGWLGIGSFFAMLAIYLIPHSIQFSKGLTYAVCYSLTGLMLLVPIIGFIRRGARRELAA